MRFNRAKPKRNIPQHNRASRRNPMILKTMTSDLQGAGRLHVDSLGALASLRETGLLSRRRHSVSQHHSVCFHHHQADQCYQRMCKGTLTSAFPRNTEIEVCFAFMHLSCWFRVRANGLIQRRDLKHLISGVGIQIMNACACFCSYSYTCGWVDLF